MASVDLRAVDFSYPVFAVTGRSLKVSLASRIRAPGAGVVHVHAIRNLSLQLRDGERLGLIGRNGSGKSTLLRILAGLAHPQRGMISVEGRVVPLIEKGLGINPELSGEANIELPLRLLGATDAEIVAARPWVEQFTGLKDFLKLPVRTYSEGMKARLAFALSTAIHGDILILDEWLSAGDIDFTERAEQHLTGMLDRARILVLATHSLELIRRTCTKVAWLSQGELVRLGPPEEVLAAYDASAHSVPRAAE